MDTCFDCKFLGKPNHYHDMGLHSGPACHRSRPAIGKDGTAEWPIVKATDWCGEYEPLARTEMEEGL